jgi:hypothetical protein
LAFSSKKLLEFLYLLQQGNFFGAFWLLKA